MKIYIASSWRNQHAVELLTDLLRSQNHEVLSFVENNNFEFDKGIPFEQWVWSDDGTNSFSFDTYAAMTSDLVIYIGPSGTDAWAEVGAAYASDVPVYGLWAKGEPAGLMRRMVTWFNSYEALLQAVDAAYRSAPDPHTTDNGQPITDKGTGGSP